MKGFRGFISRYYYYCIAALWVVFGIGVFFIAQSMQGAYLGSPDSSSGSLLSGYAHGDFGHLFRAVFYLFDNFAKAMPSILTGLLMHLFERQRQRYDGYEAAKAFLTMVKEEMLFVYNPNRYDDAVNSIVKDKEDLLRFRAFYEDAVKDAVKDGALTGVPDLSQISGLSSVISSPASGFQVAMSAKEFTFNNGSILTISQGETRLLVRGSFAVYPKMNQAKIFRFDQIYDASGTQYELLCIENIMKNSWEDLLRACNDKNDLFVRLEDSAAIVSVYPEISSLVSELYGLTRDIVGIVTSFYDVYSKAMGDKLFGGSDYLDQYVNFVNAVSLKYSILADKRASFISKLEKDFGL